MRDLEIKTGKSFLSAGPLLDNVTFDRLRQQITIASGIYIPSDENSRFIIERRLMPRLRARGLTSFSDYVGSLDSDELEQMLDAVAIHETYFFREKRQLDVFSEQILPVLEKMDRPIGIWSAGCSTGEEAYTIGMLLAERGLLDASRSRIVASDLSRRVIELGKRGIYGPSRFRTTLDSFRERYFVSTGANQWQASGELRQVIQFEQLNLMSLSPDSDSLNGSRYDVIFCRNVLMYFDTEAVKKTLCSFYSMLNEGGFLLLGHAESLLPMGTLFKPVQFGREYVHQK
ncbi:MAG TPA: protein-glutamate O-methyltransferase CheR [Blastocatellia bacterium]|nr:protein-glutamate O-methyltransferase CheR [Blastocatellia bacterium]